MKRVIKIGIEGGAVKWGLKAKRPKAEFHFGGEYRALTFAKRLLGKKKVTNVTVSDKPHEGYIKIATIGHEEHKIFHADAKLLSENGNDGYMFCRNGLVKVFGKIPKAIYVKVK